MARFNIEIRRVVVPWCCGSAGELTMQGLVESRDTAFG